MTPITANTLLVRVGKDENPLTLTDRAVEAVQSKAADNAQEALGMLVTLHQEHENALDELDFTGLVGARNDAAELVAMLEVLIDCRPLEELEMAGES